MLQPIMLPNSNPYFKKGLLERHLKGNSTNLSLLGEDYVCGVGFYLFE